MYHNSSRPPKTCIFSYISIKLTTIKIIFSFSVWKNWARSNIDNRRFQLSLGGRHSSACLGSLVLQEAEAGGLGVTASLGYKRSEKWLQQLKTGKNKANRLDICRQNK